MTTHVKPDYSENARNCEIVEQSVRSLVWVAALGVRPRELLKRPLSFRLGVAWAVYVLAAGVLSLVMAFRPEFINQHPHSVQDDGGRPAAAVGNNLNNGTALGNSTSSFSPASMAATRYGINISLGGLAGLGGLVGSGDESSGGAGDAVLDVSLPAGAWLVLAMFISVPVLFSLSMLTTWVRRCMYRAMYERARAAPADETAAAAGTGQAGTAPSSVKAADDDRLEADPDTQTNAVIAAVTALAFRIKRSASGLSLKRSASLRRRGASKPFVILFRLAGLLLLSGLYLLSCILVPLTLFNYHHEGELLDIWSMQYMLLLTERMEEKRKGFPAVGGNSGSAAAAAAADSGCKGDGGEGGEGGDSSGAAAAPPTAAAAYRGHKGGGNDGGGGGGYNNGLDIDVGSGKRDDAFPGSCGGSKAGTPRATCPHPRLDFSALNACDPLSPKSWQNVVDQIYLFATHNGVNGLLMIDMHHVLEWLRMLFFIMVAIISIYTDDVQSNVTANALIAVLVSAASAVKNVRDKLNMLDRGMQHWGYAGGWLLTWDILTAAC